MPLEETCISGILGCGLGLKEGFVPGSCSDVGVEGGGGLTESCRSCKVFCASCLRLIGLLGLKTE